VFTIQPLGIFGISFPIENTVLLRSSILLTSFGFLALYGWLDYSGFFPRHLEMEVFFDEKGVDRILSETLTTDERASLGIQKDYKGSRNDYFLRLDKEVAHLFHKSQFFSMRDGFVHSTGRTSFVVKKISGFQKYYIDEAKGELLNVLDAPHIPQKQFFTLFEKLPTAEDYLRPSLVDIFVRRQILVRPKFKQILAENRTSTGVLFNIAVVGITKVTVIPWPTFSETLYCADFGEMGLIPVAYAIYKEGP
jgi:hypothetical protein